MGASRVDASSEVGEPSGFGTSRNGTSSGVASSSEAETSDVGAFFLGQDIFCCWDIWHSDIFRGRRILWDASIAL